ncbi:hypothetical protein D3C86_1970060 [compost metagenome]
MKNKKSLAGPGRPHSDDCGVAKQVNVRRAGDISSRSKRPAIINIVIFNMRLKKYI